MPRVLVIDDDESYSAVLTTLLTRGGYEVRALRNGRALASAIAAEPFDAIITGVYMPEIDGIEVLRSVKRLIAVAGGRFSGGMDESVHRAMTVLGAAAVLTKPVDGESLLSVLRDALDPSRPKG
jgi:two-component system response regulator HydG